MKQCVMYCSHAIVCTLSSDVIAGDGCYCLGLLDGIVRERENIHQPAYSSHGRFIWSKFRFTKVVPIV